MPNSRQLHHVADTISDAASKAYDQGKSVFFSTRKKAAQQWASAVPQIQSKLSDLRDYTGEGLHRASATAKGHLYSTESLALKISGVYLLVKWLRRREQTLGQMVDGVKDHIIEKPVRSAVIALSIGYALGRLRR